MVEGGLLGYITDGKEKKRKDEEREKLVVPFINPGYHVILGGNDAGQGDIVKALINNAILAADAIVAFDTAGMIMPFLLPFLSGDHVKKVRSMKEKVPQGLVDAIKPAGFFFNSQVEDATGNAFKLSFSLHKLLLDAQKITADQEARMKSTFGTSRDSMINEILKRTIAVAFGKDYEKVKGKAASFIKYIERIFEAMVVKDVPCTSWKQAKECLTGKVAGISSPAGIDPGELDSYVHTLDYYVANAMLFKPGLPSSPVLDPSKLEAVNLYVFDFQDMNERERALAFTLLFSQYVLDTLAGVASSVDPLIIALKHAGIGIVLDEAVSWFMKDDAVLGPLEMRNVIIHEGMARDASFIIASQDPGSVDLKLLDKDLLGQLAAAGGQSNIYACKVKDKDLGPIISWIGSIKGAVQEADLSGLKSNQAILVPLKPGAKEVKFEIAEWESMSIRVSPGMVKSVLASPILISRKLAGVAPVKPAVAAVPQVNKPRPVVAVLPKPAAASVPIQPRPLTPPLATARPPEVQEAAPPEEARGVQIIPMAVPRVPATPGPAPVEELRGTVEDDLDEHHETVAGTTGDSRPSGSEEEHEDIPLETDFLSQLIGAEAGPDAAASEVEGKISRMDYNMALNALLFKLEQIVKAPHGVDFLKELMKKKAMPYDRAMEMYLQETNAVVKGRFAVQKGNSIAYQGVKEAMRAIISQLGLKIPLPGDEDLARLEAELVKSLDLPRHELLERIKNGSIYF
nr:hypothetical protein [Candidatus Sigynarchaeota archaeon]